MAGVAMLRICVATERSRLSGVAKLPASSYLATVCCPKQFWQDYYQNHHSFWKLLFDYPDLIENDDILTTALEIQRTHPFVNFGCVDELLHTMREMAGEQLYEMKKEERQKYLQHIIDTLKREAPDCTTLDLGYETKPLYRFTLSRQEHLWKEGYKWALNIGERVIDGNIEYTKAMKDGDWDMLEPVRAQELVLYQPFLLDYQVLRVFHTNVAQYLKAKASDPVQSKHFPAACIDILEKLMHDVLNGRSCLVPATKVFLELFKLRPREMKTDSLSEMECVCRVTRLTQLPVTTPHPVSAERRKKVRDTIKNIQQLIPQSHTPDTTKKMVEEPTTKQHYPVLQSTEANSKQTELLRGLYSTPHFFQDYKIPNVSTILGSLLATPDSEKTQHPCEMKVILPPIYLPVLSDTRRTLHFIQYCKEDLAHSHWKQASNGPISPDNLPRHLRDNKHLKNLQKIVKDNPELLTASDAPSPTKPSNWLYYFIMHDPLLRPDCADQGYIGETGNSLTERWRLHRDGANMVLEPKYTTVVDSCLALLHTYVTLTGEDISDYAGIFALPWRTDPESQREKITRSRRETESRLITQFRLTDMRKGMNGNEGSSSEMKKEIDEDDS